MQAVEPDGSQVTAHCPNTGSMLNCLVPASQCWVSRVHSARAKLPYRLEMVTSRYGGLAGVNTQRANLLVGEAIQQQWIPELTGYRSARAEVACGREGSRIDWLLEGGAPACFVEVKNVTLAAQDQVARFPDAVTSRGAKHLRELQYLKSQGKRAVLFFCVQLTQVDHMSIASDIDPLYARALTEAMASGVEVLAWQASLSAEQAILHRALEFSLPG